VSFS
jgi:hypothetical protein